MRNAILLGTATSMRCFTPVAALYPWLRPLAAAELVTDKTRFARERNDLPSTLARVGCGALAGRAAGSAIAGAAAALVATQLTYHARRLAPAGDFRYAVAEDAVAIGLTAYALRTSSP